MSGPFAFDASTPADAQTKPWRVSAMTSGGRVSHDLARSRARITSIRRGSSSPASSRARSRRLDPVEVDDAAFHLRDRLLRDDDDVVAREPAGAVGRFDEQRAEVVPLLELRDPAERDDAELVRQGRPVTRMPACPR